MFGIAGLFSVTWTLMQEDHNWSRTAEFKVDSTVVQVPTDDRALADLLSSKLNEDDHLISASATQHQQSDAGLRQRSKPSASSNQVPAGDVSVSPSQLRRLIKDSPFIDTQSHMTAYEWFKAITLLPWTLFRILVATPCTLLCWLVVALLVWGVPINTPLPRWRRVVMSGWIR